MAIYNPDYIVIGTEEETTNWLSLLDEASYVSCWKHPACERPQRIVCANEGSCVLVSSVGPLKIFPAVDATNFVRPDDLTMMYITPGKQIRSTPESVESIRNLLMSWTSECPATLQLFQANVAEDGTTAWAELRQ